METNQELNQVTQADRILIEKAISDYANNHDRLKTELPQVYEWTKTKRDL